MPDLYGAESRKTHRIKDINSIDDSDIIPEHDCCGIASIVIVAAVLIMIIVIIASMIPPTVSPVAFLAESL